MYLISIMSQNPTGGGTFKTEADGQQTLINILTSRKYKLTPEFCRADSGYTMDGSDNVLPIQNKFANSRKGRDKSYQFSNCLNYDEFILLCKPIDRDVSFVIPGNMITTNKTYMCMRKNVNNKWSWSMIKDDDLEKFLDNFYSAVLRNDNNCTWPSGSTVDISNINIVKLSDLSRPVHVQQNLAQEFADWGKSIMSFLKFQQPIELQTSVDVLINGFRIQEKVGRIKGDRVVFMMTKQPKAITPYNVNEFDFLLGYFLDKKNILLIPEKALIEHDILNDGITKGKTSISCYPYGRSPQTGRRPAPFWTNNYLYNVEAHNFRDKIQKVFLNCIIDCFNKLTIY